MTAPRVGDIFRRADWHAADRGAGMGGTKGPIHLLKRKPLRDLSHGFPNLRGCFAIVPQWTRKYLCY